MFDVSNLVARINSSRIKLRGISKDLESSIVGSSGQVGVPKALIAGTVM